MVLPTSPPASMSVSQILAEFGITAGTTKRISTDLFPLVGGAAGSTCLLGASFSGKSATYSVGYSNLSINCTGRSIAVDSAKNIYITGYYSSTATVPINTFGATPTTTGVSLPATSGLNDIFVIKWNAAGTLAGYSTIKGTSNDAGYGIAVDSSQNIYVTGNYSSSGTVPINTFGTAPVASGVSMPASSAGFGDAFVIKWNAAGTLAGYSTIKGTGSDTGFGIAVDSTQNIYITGNYSSSGTVPINTFGTAPAPSGVIMPATAGGTDAFVIKWNAAGTVAGYATIRGNGNDAGYGIAADSTQNIYITGTYISSTTVAITDFSTTPFASGVSMPASSGAGFGDAFVIKWNAAGGTVAGYSTIRGTDDDIGRSIAVDSAKNIYITGNYTSTATVPINTFGTAPSTTGVSMPVTTGGYDVFVIKWNAAGTLAGYSTIKGNGTGSDIGYSIAVDSSQNIYITGQYSSTGTVPINTFGTAPVASGVSMPVTSGSSDAFVIKWNAAGTLAGYSNIKGTGGDIGFGIAVDSSSNIYVTGNYVSTATVPINTFGTAPVASGVSLPVATAGFGDAFVVKWNA